MNFPWICQSLTNDFSEIIKECYTSPTEYISVADER